MRKILLVLVLFAAACTQETERISVSCFSAARKLRAETGHSLMGLLFHRARTGDAFTFSQWKPFLYFSSGRDIFPDQTTALVAEEAGDTTISISMWTLHNEIWTQQSAVYVTGPGMAFGITLADFNFDGQTDIYHNVSCSNGYALRRGNLITIDPASMQMVLHAEAGRLANMRPDSAKHCVWSCDWAECIQYGYSDTCQIANEWKNDSLITISRTCSCGQTE